MPDAPLSPPKPPRSRLAHIAGTLKFRVVLVAVVSALASGGISIYYLSQASERIASTLFSQQQADEVELVADLLNGKVLQIQDSLRLLAGEITPALLDDPRALEALLLGRPMARHLFDTLYVAGLDGRRRASLAQQRVQRPDPQVPDREPFAQTLASRQPVVAGPSEGGSLARPRMVFTMPIKTVGGELVGVMVGAVALDSGELLPTGLTMVGQFDATLVVYTRDGRILSHPDRSRVLGLVRDEPGLAPVHAAWVRDGEPVFGEGQARHPPGYLVALAGVPAAQWMVARITTAQSALGGLRAAQRRSWAVTGVIMGLSALLAAALIVWMTQPISRLRERARVLLGSDTPPEAGWPRASGEIGELVEAVRQVTIERARAHATERVMVGQLRAILDNASMGILITRARRFELVGRHMVDMLGYTEEELLGQPARMIYPSDQAYAELGRRVSEQMRADGHFDGEVQFRRKDGTLFWGHMLGRGLVPDDPEGGTIWIMHDVTAAREATQQLSWSATHDSLTQLANRREFEARLGHAMVQYQHQGVCAMFVDLDHFKAINDGAGHAAGDKALREVAPVLEQQVRQSDTVGRLGGDEFAILLIGCSLPQAREIAEEVRQAVQGMVLAYRGRRFAISASIGIVEITPSLQSIGDVLHAADTACYEAQRGGRNRVVVYQPGVTLPAPMEAG